MFRRVNMSDIYLCFISNNNTSSCLEFGHLLVEIQMKSKHRNKA